MILNLLKKVNTLDTDIEFEQTLPTTELTTYFNLRLIFSFSLLLLFGSIDIIGQFVSII